MHAEQEMQQIKGRIAKVYARREQLKQALASGRLAPRAGFPQLVATDQELSALDSRYKALWDAANPRLSPASPPRLGATDRVRAGAAGLRDRHHAQDARPQVQETVANQAALSAVYDVVRKPPGHGLGAEVHALIAAARQGPNADLAGRIHDWRVRAETDIPKPTMKTFKQFLGAAMPR